MTQDIAASVEKFAQARLLPGAASRDREGTFPHDEIRQMGAHGLMGMLIPESFGGAGSNYANLIAAIEAVAAADGVCAMLMASQNTLSNRILLDHGSDLHKRDILPFMAQGKALCAFALTEPGGGSDAFRMRTTATREGAEYVLNGGKQFITAGKNADYLITFARTSAARANAEAFSAFLIPTRTPGYAVIKEEHTLGMRASDTCQLAFDNLRLPESARIGAEGMGYTIATAHLDASRVAIAAQCIGLARAAYDIASAYAMQRQAFGKPLAGHQAIAFRLADMATQLHASRLMVRDAAMRLDAGQNCAREASMAKLFASEAAEMIAREAMQVLGGYGYTDGFAVERIYRDVRACTIYEGTSDIQRLLISNTIIHEKR